MFANGVSNGERPVLYNVTLASDPEFTQVLHEATEIPGDPSGQTTYELPNGLDPEAMYYWQAQADDGANSSDNSEVSRFEVFAPVVIAPPQIRVPTTGSGEGSAPTLVINAPVVDGPASNVTWELQVASDQGFNDVVLSVSGPISGNSVTIDVATLFGSTAQVGGASVTAQAVTAQASTGLRGNTKYHWRARVSADGREGTVVRPGHLQDTVESQRSGRSGRLSALPVAPRPRAPDPTWSFGTRVSDRSSATSAFGTRSRLTRGSIMWSRRSRCRWRPGRRQRGVRRRWRKTSCTTGGPVRCLASSGAPGRRWQNSEPRNNRRAQAAVVGAAGAVAVARATRST